MAVVSLEADQDSEKFSELTALRKLARQNKYEIKAVAWCPHPARQSLLASAVSSFSLSSPPPSLFLFIPFYLSLSFFLHLCPFLIHVMMYVNVGVCSASRRLRYGMWGLGVTLNCSPSKHIPGLSGEWVHTCRQGLIDSCKPLPLCIVLSVCVYTS